MQVRFLPGLQQSLHKLYGGFLISAKVLHGTGPYLEKIPSNGKFIKIQFIKQLVSRYLKCGIDLE
jgi:hypothetical protein